MQMFNIVAYITLNHLFKLRIFKENYRKYADYIIDENNTVRDNLLSEGLTPAL